MRPSVIKIYSVICLSFILAFLLDAFAFPLHVQVFWPQWIIMVLMFWLIALPFRVNIGIAWTLGILQDMFSGILLGTHALVYTLLAYVILKTQHRLQFFNLWQQTAVVAIFMLLSTLMQLWLENIGTEAFVSPLSFLPLATGIIIWPFLAQLLLHIKREYKLS